jgi:hypothetical protein
MSDRAVLLAGAFLVVSSCTATDGVPRGTTSPTVRPAEYPGDVPGQRDARRDRALRAARVWSEPPRPIATADLAANPPDGFRADEEVPCTFVLRASEGWSPKFECRLESGEEVKVKYGRNSVEVFGEVAATRLLSALGFGADRMYVVRAVRCRGCPVYPYPKAPILDAARQSPSREVTFTVAAIERKMPGRSIKGEHHEGWSWPELDRIDPAAGGSSRAEVDALRLMARFLNHWDTKDSNQRLVCLEGGDTAGGCSRPLALLHDLGETFGPRAVDLDGWTRTRIWSDPATCRLNMKDLPYGGTSFDEPQITEAGRRFLSERLRQLSHAQIVALFRGARFPDYVRQSKAGRDAENWAAAFEDRVRQIVDRPPCPR